MSRDLKNPPLVTIGLLSYNRCEKLKMVIGNLMRQDYENIEIIVVDNASTDGSVDMLKNLFPGITLITSEQNIGVPARNIFFKQARGKYIFEYDDDSMPAEPNAITRIVTFLEEYDDIDVLCTNVFNQTTGISETHGWERFAIAGNRIDGFEGAFLHEAGVVFKKECIQKTSGYAEDIFFGFEAADLTLKLIKNKSKIVYKPDLVTLHFEQPSPEKAAHTFGQKTMYGIWLFWRYFPVRHAVYLSAKYIIMRSLICLAKPSYAKGHIAGVFKGLAAIPRNAGFMTLDMEAIQRTKSWQEHLFHDQLFRRIKNRLGRHNTIQEQVVELSYK